MGRCAYPGDILTYECTLERGVATVWKLDIISYQHKVHIVFLHSLDEFNDTKQISCYNSTIIGENINVGNTTHTSRVNITATCELNGTTIQCTQDDGLTESMIGSSTIISKLSNLSSVYEYSFDKIPYIINYQGANIKFSHFYRLLVHFCAIMAQNVFCNELYL